MKLIGKFFLSFFSFLIVLFCFFNTHYFEPWCYENEKFIFDAITSEELINKVRDYYCSNDDIWVWNKDNRNQYSLAFKRITTGFGENIFSEENVLILIKNKIYKIKIPTSNKMKVVRIEIEGIYDFKKEMMNNDTSVNVTSNSLEEINRLNRTEENVAFVKDFENQFVKKLDLKYLWEEPSSINILFSKMYRYFHK